MVRERIARVRYERTMTMREPKDDKGQGFESLLTEEEKAGLSEEEKMKRIAAKMEEKFKSEQRRVSTVTAVSHLIARAHLSRHHPQTFTEKGTILGKFPFENSNDTPVVISEYGLLEAIIKNSFL